MTACYLLYKIQGKHHDYVDKDDQHMCYYWNVLEIDDIITHRTLDYLTPAMKT